MTTEVLKQVERVSIKLRKAVRTFDNGDRRAFGSESHQFRLRPPLSISEIEAFESRYEIKLPLDYRIFLCMIGNGGAGPAYGMLSLQSAVSYQRFEAPEDILKTPFPHEKSFNPLKDEDPFGDELERRLESSEITESEFDRMIEYETAGTLVLCDEGCGHLHRLVVTGPSHGEMWMDSTCSDQGYFSLQVGFLSWYERWLDQVVVGGAGTWWFESKWFP